MENKILNNKFLYWSLIITFTLLYICIGFVSFYHAVSFFEITNTIFLSVILAIAFELGQSSVLFYILMSKDKKFLPWAMMFMLTLLQIIGNVYSSFKFMDLSHTNDYTYFQRSILFAVQADSPEMYKIIISWISGGLLPIVALGMTSLISHIVQSRSEQTGKEKSVINDTLDDKNENLKEENNKSIIEDTKEETFKVGDKEYHNHGLLNEVGTEEGDLGYEDFKNKEKLGPEKPNKKKPKDLKKV